MYNTSTTLSIQNAEIKEKEIEKIPPMNPFIGGCKNCTNYKIRNGTDAE